MKKFFMICSLFILVGCGNAAHTEPAQQNQAPQVATEEPILTEDNTQQATENEINSIISLAPSKTEVLIALGLADKIVAIDQNSAQVVSLPNEPQIFEMLNPNAEQLLLLGADIMFASTMTLTSGEDAIRVLEANGLEVIALPSSQSIQSIYEDIMFIAEITGTVERGQEIVSEMRAEIEAIAAIGETITDRKTVYFEISPEPSLFSFGSGVFLNEMIEIIGAENILADEEGWIPVNAEIIITANPDVILSNVNFAGDPVPEIMGRDAFQNINAVINGDVFYIYANYSSVPNHNIIVALRKMAQLIYPDYFYNF